MGSTFSGLAYHLVFSTKYRKATLTDLIRPAIYEYIGGIIANKHGRMIEIGGIADHVHILTSCPTTVALADFVRDIKANSSKWLHEEKRERGFQWQSGYGVFTVSRSQVEVVRHYIGNQAEHHRKQSFKEEFRGLLIKHGIEFEEKYLFENETIAPQSPLEARLTGE